MLRILVATLSASVIVGHCVAQMPEDHKLPMVSFSGSFVDPDGVLANQRTAEGPPWPWIGLQYLDNGYGKPVINDTTEYWRGYFENGGPTGTWLHHGADGRYSLGSYICSDWYTFVDTEGEEHTGCHRYYIKDGVWGYYDSDSTLLRTERYSRFFEYQVCGIDSFFVVDSAGKETLIHYNWRNDTHRSRSFFHHRTRNYDDAGHLLDSSEWNSRKHMGATYFLNGRPKRMWKSWTFLGFRINRMVVTDYSEDGKNKVRSVERAWTKSRVY